MLEPMHMLDGIKTRWENTASRAYEIINQPPAAICLIKAFIQVSISWSHCTTMTDKPSLELDEA